MMKITQGLALGLLLLLLSFVSACNSVPKKTENVMDDNAEKYSQQRQDLPKQSEKPTITPKAKVTSQVTQAEPSVEMIKLQPIEEAKAIEMKAKPMFERELNLIADNVNVDNTKLDVKPKRSIDKPKRKQPNQVVVEAKTQVQAQTKPTPIEFVDIKDETAKPTESTALGEINGQVILFAEGGKKMDATEVIVTVEELGTKKIQPRSPKTHTVNMFHKIYQPSHLVVQTGDKIIFDNLDDFKHNVFSSSGSNKFDLGTYASGERPAVTLSKSGLVKVYCNIHPSMAMFIMVTNSNRYFITKADGQFHIKDLPAGSYILKVWHIRGESKQFFELKAGESLNLKVKLDTKNYKPTLHLNKYGKQYPKKSILFEDDNEFY